MDAIHALIREMYGPPVAEVVAEIVQHAKDHKKAAIYAIAQRQGCAVGWKEIYRGDRMVIVPADILRFGLKMNAPKLTVVAVGTRVALDKVLQAANILEMECEVIRVAAEE